jgi:hypothetical protein
MHKKISSIPPVNALKEIRFTTEQLKSLKINPLQTSKTFLEEYNKPENALINLKQLEMISLSRRLLEKRFRKFEQSKTGDHKPWLINTRLQHLMKEDLTDN